MRLTTATPIAAAWIALLMILVPSDAPGQDIQAKFIEKVMEKFDKDGNGQLDAAEMRAAMEYRQKMQAKADNDEPVAKPKLTEAELLKMYDINRNGRLDPEERILAEQDQKKKDDTAIKKDDEPKKIVRVGEESWDDFEKRLLVKYDANENKKLDTAERRKAAGDIAKWRVDQRKIKQQKEIALRGLTLDQRRLVAMFDDNHNYKLDEEERAYASEQFKRLRKGGFDSAVELRDRFMKQFDRNNNGKLDPSEKPAATQFVLKIAAQLHAANRAEKQTHKPKQEKKWDRPNQKEAQQAKEAKRLFGG